LKGLSAKLDAVKVAAVVVKITVFLLYCVIRCRRRNGQAIKRKPKKAVYRR